MKNVLIAADMEGITGIDDYRGCLPSHPSAYARGCELMTEEVRVAVDALRRGGVERITVGDWHMVGTNVLRDRMPAGVDVRPIADLALVDADPSFTSAQGGAALDAVVLLGHHAGTTNARGFSSHTFVWDMEVELDGESLSEVRVYAQGLASEGIPVLVASGDRWMLDELDPGELGGAALVATKEGAGRGRAASYDRGQVHAHLAEGIAAALASPPQPPPARAYPAELRISVEGRELAATTVAAPSDLLRTVATVFRTSKVSREYRQLASLFPAAPRLRRRVGALVATPVMRSKERRWLASSS